MARFFLPIILAIASTPFLGPIARADDPPAIRRVFTASDLPHMARGIHLARAGDYTLKVWGDGNRRWKATADGPAVTLRSTVEGDAAAPAWQDLGAFPLTEHAKILVDGIETLTAPATGEDKPQPVAVPAILSLSTDPGFEASSFLNLARVRPDTTAPPEDPRRTTVRSNQYGADFAATGDKEAWLGRAKMCDGTCSSRSVYGRCRRKHR